jgi:hypothetical protein
VCLGRESIPIQERRAALNKLKMLDVALDGSWPEIEELTQKINLL